jgi:hypothetical protein
MLCDLMLRRWNKPLYQRPAIISYRAQFLASNHRYGVSNFIIEYLNTLQQEAGEKRCAQQAHADHFAWTWIELLSRRDRALFLGERARCNDMRSPESFYKIQGGLSSWIGAVSEYRRWAGR